MARFCSVFKFRLVPLICSGKAFNTQLFHYHAAIVRPLKEHFTMISHTNFKLFLLLLISSASIFFSGNAAAWNDDDVDVIDEVVCESYKGRVAYCDIDTQGDVVLVEQISRSQCVEGQSWGVDRRGLWVSQGCRGNFASVVQRQPQRRGGGGYAPQQPAGTVVRCESYDQQQAYCALPFRGRVRLVNQVSRAACTEGYSWGFDRRGVWVSRGCRGDFEVY